MSSRPTTVTAELGLRLVLPDSPSVPVAATIRYDVADPYAVHAVFRDLELALTKALERARSTGEIPARGDVAAQARMLVALLEGLQVVAKTEPDPARLADAVDAALAMLG